MSGACFHSLREALLKNRNIKSLKFYSQTSDKFFNDMFLEMTRFFEEVIRKSQFTSLKSLILSKGNKMRFKRELADEKSVLYIAENRQLTDIVFQVEKSRKFADQIKSVVFRSKLGASKDFAFYLNEFFKECVNLESIMFVNTNLGELMRSSKNVMLPRPT